MQIKIEITKKLITRMALFVAIIGVAFLFDAYLDKNPAELQNIQTEAGEHAQEPGAYLITQTNSTTVKTSEENSSARRLQVQLHDKFLRKYHQIRNNQVLQAEEKTQTAPLIQSYHYLVFQNYFFSQPDEDPLV